MKKVLIIIVVVAVAGLIKVFLDNHEPDSYYILPEVQL